MLHQFLIEHLEEVIARSQIRAAGRLAPRPNEAELKSGVPLFLGQLIGALQEGDAERQIGRSAALNGSELLKQGITIAQVVHAYGDICQTVTELAIEKAAPISTEEWQTFNRCQDHAVAEAVTEYARQREGLITSQGTERIGCLVHELRNLINAAMLSFEVIKSGSVTPGGATSAVMDRTLKSMRELIDRSLTEVRLEAQIHKPERVAMAEFIEEIEITAALDAKARNLHLSVARVEYGLAVRADPQLLASAVSNLLQNALKFTRPGGNVSLRVHATDDLVLIEVEDECGGLPPGKVQDLFCAFEQRGENRSGLGLGLFISRRAIEISGGRIYIRNFPGRGCAFVIELPKLPKASTTSARLQPAAVQKSSPA